MPNALLQNGECHEETIKFGLECMYVDSWARRRTYNAFKEALGSGVRHHLQVWAKVFLEGWGNIELAIQCRAELAIVIRSASSQHDAFQLHWTINPIILQAA